jgi:hypothetical protein
MQTKPETEVTRVIGMRQAPILRLSDLRPGIMFTGVAADHVHAVVSIEGETLVAQRLPVPPMAREPGHTHAFAQFGNTACACGLWRMPVQSFLPDASAGTPRIHALVPLDGITEVRAYSIYVMEDARGALVLRSGTQRGEVRPAAPAGADTEVPVILRAAQVWGLPDDAVRLIEELDARNVATPGDPQHGARATGR